MYGLQRQSSLISRDENNKGIRKAETGTELQVKVKIPRGVGKGKQFATEPEVTAFLSSARECTKAMIAFERNTNADQ